MRRGLLAVSLVLALPAFAATDLAIGDRPAEASVSMRLSLPELVKAATYVVIGTPAEHYSQWEDLAGGRRIVTYTRVAVDRQVVGAPGSEVWVRTLGGGVGSIGQVVPGEAQLASGQRALLFLTKAPGIVVVTGLGQGHYPIALDESGSERLRAPASRPGLIPRQGPSIGADEVLLDSPVDTAVVAIQSAHRAIQDAEK